MMTIEWPKLTVCCFCAFVGVELNETVALCNQQLTTEKKRRQNYGSGSTMPEITVLYCAMCTLCYVGLCWSAGIVPFQRHWICVLLLIKLYALCVRVLMRTVLYYTSWWNKVHKIFRVSAYLACAVWSVRNYVRNVLYFESYVRFITYLISTQAYVL